MKRRHFLKTAVTLPFLSLSVIGCATTKPALSMTYKTNTLLQNLLSDLLPSWENKLNAKIGMAVITASNNELASYRGNDFFPFNSTIKAFIGAYILQLVDKGQLDLTHTLQIKATDLLEYAPQSKKFFEANQPISIAELSEAMITVSDNTASNLLLDTTGGLKPFNDFLHQIGNSEVILAHNEPLLNRSHYGEKIDTVKPIAYTQALKNILMGNILSEQSKKLLLTWLINDKVGDSLLRKHLPNDWQIGDKTGAGDESRNIVAIIWNSQKEAYFVSLFITQPYDGKSHDFNNQKSVAIAEIGRAIYSIL